MVWQRNCRENTHTRQTVIKNKSPKLHLDEEIYKEACNTIQNLIRKKKESILWGKIKGKHTNQKKLWKTIKQLGLPEKRLAWTNVCLKAKEELKFDPCTVSELFKKFYSNLANDLVRKLPVATNKFDIERVQKTIIMICLKWVIIN